MKPNRYIKAMEIGLANENEGITYNDLVDEVQKHTKRMTLYAESTFYYWFIDNFSATNIELKNYSGWKPQFQYYYYFKHGIGKKKGSLTDSGESLYKQLDKVKWFLNGEAAKQYLDYQELVESRQTAQDARKASKEANKKASTSIKLAVAAIIISAVVGIASIIIDLKTPKPPYDVNVIENKVQQKEMESLREELNKTKLLLETMVSDTISK